MKYNSCHRWAKFRQGRIQAGVAHGSATPRVLLDGHNATQTTRFQVFGKLVATGASIF